jgi:hypothetical protein
MRRTCSSSTARTDRIYAVAVGDSGVLNTASRRVDAPANNQLKGIRWAVDQDLPA